MPINFTSLMLESRRWHAGRREVTHACLGSMPACHAPWRSDANGDGVIDACDFGDMDLSIPQEVSLNAAQLHEGRSATWVDRGGIEPRVAVATWRRVTLPPAELLVPS